MVFSHICTLCWVLHNIIAYTWYGSGFLYATFLYAYYTMEFSVHVSCLLPYGCHVPAAWIFHYSAPYAIVFIPGCTVYRDYDQFWVCIRDCCAIYMYIQPGMWVPAMQILCRRSAWNYYITLTYILALYVWVLHLPCSTLLLCQPILEFTVGMPSWLAYHICSCWMAGHLLL